MAVKERGFIEGISDAFICIISAPFYLVKGVIKGIVFLFKKLSQKEKEEKIEGRRKLMKANYNEFKILESDDGDLKKWEKNVAGKSKIGLILGARGSGKTAFGLKLLENIYAKTGKKCYGLGFVAEEMPLWVEVIEDIGKIKNNSVVLIDEGGVLFSSRRAMTNANKILSDLILISRHKNLSIIFISQNSANLDVNIIREADFLALKPSSLLQKDFERKKIKELYEELEKKFSVYKDKKGITYIYSDDFIGFVLNPLPSFWSDKIGKSFGQ
ncbi:hypothetical protein HYV50_00075 [Candidatus Pacearchaeota archaeon]|nr:hypothetical protein [Candidatus Pacearchaeota archaeon]